MFHVMLLCLLEVSEMVTFMSRREVEQVTGISRSTIYDKLNAQSNYYDPDFPRQIKIGVKAVRWRSNEVYDWIEKKSNPKYFNNV